MAVAEAVVLSAASFLNLQSMDEKQSEIVNVSRLHGDELSDENIVDGLGGRSITRSVFVR